MGLLRNGDTGPAVLNLQNNLIKLSFHVKADGIFGDETTAAVHSFQALHGLSVDEIVGPLTQTAIAKALVSQVSPLPPGPTPWMDWLKSHDGEPEITGSKPTAFDIEVFSHTDYGKLEEMDAGCAATACAALEETGYLSPHDASAISFKGYGTDLKLQLIPGCGIVMQHPLGGHHVTFLDHIIDNRLFAGRGGNQSHKVCVKAMNRSEIIYTFFPVKKQVAV